MINKRERGKKDKNTKETKKATGKRKGKNKKEKRKMKRKHKKKEKKGGKKGKLDIRTPVSLPSYSSLFLLVLKGDEA